MSGSCCHCSLQLEEWSGIGSILQKRASKCLLHLMTFIPVPFPLVLINSSEVRQYKRRKCCMEVGGVFMKTHLTFVLEAHLPPGWGVPMSLSIFFWPQSTPVCLVNYARRVSGLGMSWGREKKWLMTVLIVFLFLEKAHLLWFPEDVGILKQNIYWK